MAFDPPIQQMMDIARSTHNTRLRALVRWLVSEGLPVLCDPESPWVSVVLYLVAHRRLTGQHWCWVRVAIRERTTDPTPREREIAGLTLVLAREMNDEQRSVLNLYRARLLAGGMGLTVPEHREVARIERSTRPTRFADYLSVVWFRRWLDTLVVEQADEQGLLLAEIEVAAGVGPVVPLEASGVVDEFGAQVAKGVTEADLAFDFEGENNGRSGM